MKVAKEEVKRAQREVADAQPSELILELGKVKLELELEPEPELQAKTIEFADYNGALGTACLPQTGNCAQGPGVERWAGYAGATAGLARGVGCLR